MLIFYNVYSTLSRYFVKDLKKQTTIELKRRKKINDYQWEKHGKENKGTH